MTLKKDEDEYIARKEFETKNRFRKKSTKLLPWRKGPG